MKNQPLIIGEGSNMEINPTLWEKWNSDACDRDDWKHGRVKQNYLDNYDLIEWDE